MSHFRFEAPELKPPAQVGGRIGVGRDGFEREGARAAELRLFLLLENILRRPNAVADATGAREKASVPPST